MKKLLLFIINFCFVAAMGQNLIAPINISLPANTPANTADWATAMPPVIIMAQTKMQNGQIPGAVIESKILVTIKSGGSIICGSYNPQTAPQSNFNSVTKTWNGAAVLSLLGKDCILKPGTYELCVQFYALNASQGGLLGEACKSFTIGDTKQQSYSPPQNTLPVNGKVFTEQEANMPIMFRWTPVVPKPQGDVLYKLRLIEILPGQNKTEALRTNTPIDILEVKNNTQTSYKLSKRITGLYWEVEAESAERGQGLKPRSYGKSEATSITIKTGDSNPEKFNPPVNQLPVDGKVFTEKEAAQPIVLRWTPVVPRPKEDVVYKVRVIEIKKGQPRAEALKTNTPIEVLEVKNETQVTSKLSKRCNGCEYLWDVTATGTERVQGKEPKSYGTGEATAFSITGNCGIELLNTKIDCDSIINGKQRYKICMDIKNISDQNLIFNNPGNNASTNPYISPSFVGAIAGINTTGNFPFAPGIGTITGATYPNVLTVGSITNFCFYYTPPGPGTYYFAATAKSQINNLCTAWDSIELVLPQCICTDCDKSLISWQGLTVNPTSNPSIFNATGNINISGLPSIYGIEIQVQSYSFSANPAACSNGVTSLEQSGVILQPGSTINGLPGILFNETISGLSSSNNNISKSIKLKSNTPLPSNLPLNLNFGLPAPIAGLNSNCCKITYNLCLKVTVFYDDKTCKSCTFTHCFPAFTN